MIHTDSIAFIHFMKTGGMSMTRHLINITDEPVTLFADPASFPSSFKMAQSPDRRDKLTCLSGRRHATLTEATELMRSAGLKVPPRAFVMIRHPVDLLLSFYKHLQKPKVWAHRGMTADTLKGYPKIATERPFREFVQRIRFYGLDDDGVMDYFDTSVFDQLDVVPLDRVESYLQHRFGRNRNFQGVALPHQNRSDGGQSADQVDPRLHDRICDTYPRLLAAYETALTTHWQD